MNYDYNTKNQSFLDLHNYLKERGIKNNNFMLQLNNSDLRYIDPFNPNITREEMAMVILESINNFWYFIREIVRWEKVPGSFEYTKLDRGNAAMYWCTLHDISSWRTNIRQTCSDLSVNSILLWKTFAKTLFTSRIISIEHPNAKRNIKMIAELSKSLPAYMAGMVVPKTKSNIDNINNIENILIHSRVEALPTPQTKDHAYGVFRGHNNQIQFFHMAEFIKNLKILVENRAPVLQSLDKKCINIFNSSYGYNGKESTIFSQEYIEEMIKWQDRFYDYSIDELSSTINKYSNGVVYIKHSYVQLGYDEDILNYLSKVLPEMSFKREILLQRV
jgi:hypothetical protein